MTGSGTAVVVEAHDETADTTVDLRRWSEVARSTLTLEGVRAGRLDLIFVDSEAMAELNREHMGHEGPTDVLAFPLDGPTALADRDDTPAGEGTAGDDGPGGLDPAGAAVGDPSLHLGDVVVCPRVATEQASAHTGSEDAELTLLVVHGLLHVLGHDHAEATETARMRGRERVHLERYGFAHPEGG
ncbi:MAG: rRNA maturation RNase YbeY [Actinomycetota bacterium]